MGMEFIYQLRVGLSKLKSHKKRDNFVKNSDDRCNCISEKEDTFHFFVFVFPIFHTLSRTTKRVFSCFDYECLTAALGKRRNISLGSIPS